MSHYILDKRYKSAERAALPANRVVVPGPHPGTCRLPGEGTRGESRDGFLGVTVHGVNHYGAGVAVRKAGIARCEAAGPIEVGQAVTVAADGRVEAVVSDPTIQGLTALIGAPPRTVECLGFAETAAKGPGAVVEVFLQMHQRVV